MALFKNDVEKAGGYYEKKDYAKAFELYKKAVKKTNNVYAKYSLGYMYYHGQGTNPDYECAFHYFINSMSGNYADALYYLGMMTKEGKGCGKDLSSAVNFFKMAADKGDKEAQYELALMVFERIEAGLNEKTYGNNDTFNNGLECMKKAAAQGHEGAKKWLCDNEEAIQEEIEWREEEAQDKKAQAEKEAREKSRREQTEKERRGKESSVNIKSTPSTWDEIQAALSELYKRGKSGDLAALFEYGEMFYSGRYYGKSGDRYPEQGVEHIKEAAQKGYVPALLSLGRIYEKDDAFSGKGGMFGIDWMKRAAAQGNEEAIEFVRAWEAKMKIVGENEKRKKEERERQAQASRSYSSSSYKCGKCGAYIPSPGYYGGTFKCSKCSTENKFN